MTPALLLSVDAQAVAHAAVALRRHRAVLVQLGRPVPDGLGALEAAFAAVARQEPPLTVTGRQLSMHTAAAADDGGMVTIPQAARLLGLSVRTVERRVQDGTLEARRIGRARRIPRKALEGLGR